MLTFPAVATKSSISPQHTFRVANRPRSSLPPGVLRSSVLLPVDRVTCTIDAESPSALWERRTTPEFAAGIFALLRDTFLHRSTAFGALWVSRRAILPETHSCNSTGARPLLAVPIIAVPLSDLNCCKPVQNLRLLSLGNSANPRILLPGRPICVGQLCWQTMTTSDKYPRITVRVSSTDIARISILSAIKRRPRSEVVRESINFYFNAMTRQNKT